MTSVKCPPAIAQIHLIPGAKVHGQDKWHADVAQITRRIASRNVERATKSDGEVLEIAANAQPLGENVECSLRRARIRISEYDFTVYPIIDRLNSLQAWRIASNRSKRCSAKSTSQ